MLGLVGGEASFNRVHGDPKDFQPSRPFFLSAPSRPSSPPLPVPVVPVVKEVAKDKPKEDEGDDDGSLVPVLSLEKAGSPEEWMTLNLPALMEAGSTLALKGKDKGFRRMFFSGLLELQIARVKALGNVKAAEAGGGLSEEEIEMVKLAKKTASRSAGDAMSRLRELNNGV